MIDIEAMEVIDSGRTYCLEDGNIIGIDIVFGFAWERPFNCLADCLAWVDSRTD